MALDVVPVGAALIDNTDELPEYLGAEAQDVTSVGSIIEPSLEQIAELDPDLILGAKSRHEDLYEGTGDHRGGRRDRQRFVNRRHSASSERRYCAMRRSTAALLT